MLSIVRWKRHKINTCVVVKALGYLHCDGCICDVEENTECSFGVIEGYVFKEGPYDAPWPENYRAKWKGKKNILAFFFIPRIFTVMSEITQARWTSFDLPP